MKNHIWIWVSLLMVISPLQAKENLILNTTLGGYPPFFIHQGADNSGIIFDVMNYISQRHNLTLRTVELPKKRVTKHMDAGFTDVTATAKEWSKNPDKYIFSDPILEMKEVLFYTKKQSMNFGNTGDLIGKTLAIHLGYKYPMYTEQFNSGQIKTIVETSELKMLKSTLYKRAEAAVINETVANWIIKNEPSLQNIFSSKTQKVGSFDYRMMFTKKWVTFVGVFNQELALMKKNGELQKIFDKYKE